MKTKFLSMIVASVFVLSSTVQPAKAGSDTEVFGTLIGAAVGGFVGSNVGKGKGQLAATAVGVLLGAGIGNTVATLNTGYNNTVYAPQPRVVYTPRPRVVERVVYVERPVERVVYVKQKPRHHTKHIVMHHKYSPPKHAKAYGWKKGHRKDDRRRVYYNKRSYKNGRYVTYRHNS